MMPTDQTRPAVPPYGRADAIIDGLLIAVPEVLSRKFGFEYRSRSPRAPGPTRSPGPSGPNSASPDPPG